MATQKEVLERMVNREELIYWAIKNDFVLEDFPGGVWVDEWQINLENNNIISVERRLDEPGQL
jgi:hypothetical protein